SRFDTPHRVVRAPPPVAITALRSGSVTVEPTGFGGPVHTDADASVSFAALRFSNQSAIRFRYRLLNGRAEGRSDDKVQWIATRDRDVNFASLSPGLHRFEVEASEGDGQWSRHPASIEVVVPTPWWQQWWAVGLMI